MREKFLFRVLEIFLIRDGEVVGSRVWREGWVLNDFIRFCGCGNMFKASYLAFRNNSGIDEALNSRDRDVGRSALIGCCYEGRFY